MIITRAFKHRRCRHVRRLVNGRSKRCLGICSIDEEKWGWSTLVTVSYERRLVRIWNFGAPLFSHYAESVLLTSTENSGALAGNVELIILGIVDRI